MSVGQSSSAFKDVSSQYFTPKDLKSVGLKLKDHKLEIVYTRSARILVEAHIAVKAPNRKVVDYLVELQKPVS